MPAGALVWSADGAFLALLTAKGVTIFDGDSEEQAGTLPPEMLPWHVSDHMAWFLCQCCASIACVFEKGQVRMQAAFIDAPNPAAVAFSPGNTYLTTFQKPQQGAGNAEKNLKVAVKDIRSE